MPRTRHSSPQTRLILATLSSDPLAWRYGLSLSKETGLKAGTLYPLLMRLADQGYLETNWAPSEMPGRPPRHAYRLTAQGIALAAERQSAVPALSFKVASA